MSKIQQAADALVDAAKALEEVEQIAATLPILRAQRSELQNEIEQLRITRDAALLECNKFVDERDAHEAKIRAELVASRAAAKAAAQQIADNAHALGAESIRLASEKCNEFIADIQKHKAELDIIGKQRFDEEQKLERLKAEQAALKKGE
jgi:predicted dithiol-disulfide oxidoreductase (DUF899 family)